MMQRWMAQMNSRERKLALAVAGLLFLVINFAIWSTLFGMSSGARSQYAEQRNLRKEQQVYLAEEKTWKTRADWLAKEQPTLSNPAEASSLLTQIKEIASKHSVQIEDPQIGAVENTPSHQSVSATFQTKSGWEPLVHFLYDAQRPTGFAVFEQVNLMVDGNDATVMQGRFKVAKWFKAKK